MKQYNTANLHFCHFYFSRNLVKTTSPPAEKEIQRLGCLSFYLYQWTCCSKSASMQSLIIFLRMYLAVWYAQNSSTHCTCQDIYVFVTQV